ncbi:predicted protein [Sclerotinia sclerotiorum 1980 UF-70]|uniref:Uncharacterized protein n=1 Tax=Sclerotinia sclerotiorum (strain ATCC 18683 / 1980 / Ss-1) TaxID=665079 RepID=A7ED81_SCLS1|nr:predicted protein [Sclerotinia sclerotiorum 1980 UF-70]EDO00797.1 predicted protein [Sclerotinia sclerotiorum 1980 UF-70]
MTFKNLTLNKEPVLSNLVVTVSIVAFSTFQTSLYASSFDYSVDHHHVLENLIRIAPRINKLASGNLQPSTDTRASQLKLEYCLQSKYIKARTGPFREKYLTNYHLTSVMLRAE